MKLLSPKEASIILSERRDKNGDLEGPISERQVQNEIKKGHLKAQRVGKRQYGINPSDLLHYVRRKPGVKAKP